MAEDGDGLVTSADQAVIAGLQGRVQAALEGFLKLNTERALVDGLGYAPPDGWSHSASIQTLLGALVEAGVMTSEQFLVGTLMRQAEILESSLREAAEDMRQTTGVIVPLGRATRPQG
jgi:hypothetical protein